MLAKEKKREEERGGEGNIETEPIARGGCKVSQGNLSFTAKKQLSGGIYGGEGARGAAFPPPHLFLVYLKSLSNQSMVLKNLL